MNALRWWRDRWRAITGPEELAACAEAALVIVVLFSGALVLFALVIAFARCASAAPAVTWWLDVQLDARQLTPLWELELEELLDAASALYSAQDHPLDVACPIELRPYSIRVYTPPASGAAPEGAGPYPRTRLYVYPGPGWAVGSAAGNWARAWVGYWCPPGELACPNGHHSAGVLLDPWGRGSAAWAVAHELGHAARLQHRVVTREADCSLMAYGDMLQGVTCPANGARLTQSDCDAIRRRALERPEVPPLPLRPVLVP